jgi:hypothetical protein
MLGRNEEFDRDGVTEDDRRGETALAVPIRCGERTVQRGPVPIVDPQAGAGRQFERVEAEIQAERTGRCDVASPGPPSVVERRPGAEVGGAEGDVLGDGEAVRARPPLGAGGDGVLGQEGLPVQRRQYHRLGRGQVSSAGQESRGQARLGAGSGQNDGGGEQQQSDGVAHGSPFSLPYVGTP